MFAIVVGIDYVYGIRSASNTNRIRIAASSPRKIGTVANSVASKQPEERFGTVGSDGLKLSQLWKWEFDQKFRVASLRILVI